MSAESTRCVFWSNFPDAGTTFQLASRAGSSCWGETKINTEEVLFLLWNGCRRGCVGNDEPSDVEVCCAKSKLRDVALARSRSHGQCAEKPCKVVVEPVLHWSARELIDRHLFEARNGAAFVPPQNTRRPKFQIQPRGLLPPGCRYEVDPGLHTTYAGQLDADALAHIAELDRTHVVCELPNRSTSRDEVNPFAQCDRVATQLRVGLRLETRYIHEKTEGALP